MKIITSKIRYLGVDVIYWLAGKLPARFFQALLNLVYSPKIEKSFTAAVTSICNARCIFCAYPRTDQPHEHMPLQTFILGLEAWKAEGGKHIDLTPTVGDPLLDPTIVEKIRRAKAADLSVSMTTNAIRLGVLADGIIVAGLNEIFFSLPSFNCEIYQQVYGVDRALEVAQNIRRFLIHNKKLNEPVKVRLRFRNSERPSRIMSSKEFQDNVAPFLSRRVTVTFTHGYDNWGGLITLWDMQGVMRMKKQINSDLPCRLLNGITMLPNGVLRACACRFVKGHFDDLVVGHINGGLPSARARATLIAAQFARGDRPETCKKCTYYAPQSHFKVGVSKPATPYQKCPSDIVNPFRPSVFET